MGAQRIAMVLGGCVVAVAVGAAAYLLPPGTADIRIEVTSDGEPVAKVEIYVDDRKVCDLSPCRIQVPEGEMWVRAVSGGRSDQMLLIAEAGEWADLRLDLSPGAHVSPTAAASGRPER